MHDWHRPHPNGPPLADQSCAKVQKGSEGTDEVITYCGKLFPRPVRRPGEEAVAEDPHRRELYRVWLARNCHFMNNFHPLLLLALLANMDVQAVTNRFAVVQYITKYMTKTGQGSLLGQAEQAFDEVLAAAVDSGKGVVSAMVGFFNRQVAPRAISQLEVHHHLWKFPASMSSRSFTRLTLSSELRKLREPSHVALNSDGEARLTRMSNLERYQERGKERMPREPHPFTQEVFAEQAAWATWCQGASWWDWRRLVWVTAARGGAQAHFVAKPKIVHVSPWIHFSKVFDPERHYSSCRHALLAYCAFPNKHPQMSSARVIQGLADVDADALLADWLGASSKLRRQHGWNEPPAFLLRDWEAANVADAKRVAKAERQAKEAKKTRIHFEGARDERPDGGEEEEPGDRAAQQGRQPWADLAARAKMRLRRCWKEAEAAEEEEFAAKGGDDGGFVLRRADLSWLRSRKWGQEELRDALLALRLALPERQTRLAYLSRLRAHCGDKTVMATPGGLCNVKAYDVWGPTTTPATQKLKVA